jgi:tRNA G10  N-methylase Trm11
VADVTQPGAISAALSQPVDLVIGDLPYGQLSHWHGAARHDEPIWHLLNQLQQVLHGQSVVALATPKGTTVAHENYDRYGRFRHGKRMITFLKRAQ